MCNSGTYHIEVASYVQPDSVLHNSSVYAVGTSAAALESRDNYCTTAHRAPVTEPTAGLTDQDCAGSPTTT